MFDTELSSCTVALQQMQTRTKALKILMKTFPSLCLLYQSGLHASESADGLEDAAQICHRCSGRSWNRRKRIVNERRGRSEIVVWTNQKQKLSNDDRHPCKERSGEVVRSSRRPW